MRRKRRFPPTSPPQNRLYAYVKEKYPSALLNEPIPIPWRRYYYYPDVLIPELKVVIEYDGRKEHAGKRMKDAERDRVLAALGYLTIRINKVNFWGFVQSMEETINRELEKFKKTEPRISP